MTAIEHALLPVRFGGFMMGGVDGHEAEERALLRDAVARLD